MSQQQPAAETFNLAGIDLSDRDLYRQGFPHPLFAQLREQAPVFRHPASAGVMQHQIEEPFWVVSRFADVRQVSRDTETFSATDGPSIQPFPPERRNNTLVSMDPPDHRRLRGLISKGFFLPTMVNQMEGQIQNWCRKIVDDVIERGECEFVNDLAYRLPMNVIADLVGIPESARAHLFDCVNRLMLVGEPSLGITQQERDQLEAEIFSYGVQLAEEKRKKPVNDVWTVLTQAKWEDDSGGESHLSDWELALFFLVLVIAGSETTRNALSSGFLTFVNNPEQLHNFVHNPALHEPTADEVLRWTSPVLFFARTATRDTVLRGVDIAAGDRVSIWYPSANRDAAEFANPDTFDISRDSKRQTALGGGGPHLCLGAHLARKQISAMFSELFSRTKNFEVGDTEWFVSGLQNNVTCSLAPFQVKLQAK
tara:strand:- start:32764 stop:34038 length:1275 start_codon:yes stop_codon:yes gene_type:complete